MDTRSTQNRLKNGLFPLLLRIGSLLTLSPFYAVLCHEAGLKLAWSLRLIDDCWM